MMSKLPHLRQIYPFQFEDDYKLIYKDYLGECHTSDSWVVVTRCRLNLHSTKVIKIQLLSLNNSKGRNLGFGLQKTFNYKKWIFRNVLDRDNL